MFYLPNTVRRRSNLLYQSYDFSSLFSRIDTINDSLISTNLSSNNTINPPSLPNAFLSYPLQFWFSLTFIIPSLVCYLFVLFFILTDKTQRQALHNHSILVLLVLSLFIVLFDYSWNIDSYRHGGQVWIASDVFCKIWWMFDFGFYNGSTVILAWASFERHILIFHSNLLSTKRRILFIHYLPLIIILLYLFTFYTYVLFFPPCETNYDFTFPTCGDSPCYLNVPSLGMWGLVVDGITSTFLIAFFNVALLARILWQKRRNLNWKRYRKMAFQLLSISALYLSVNLPLMIMDIGQVVIYPTWGFEVGLYLLLFASLIQYLFPFVCLASLPDVWLKMKTFFTRKRQDFVPTTNVRSTFVQQQETRM